MNQNSKPLRAFLSVAILIVGICTGLAAQTPGQPATASQTSSCPADTTEGVYNRIGEDDNGEPICKFFYYNECPYAADHSADDAVCQKLKAQQKPQAQKSQHTVPVQKTNQCGGK